MLRAILRNAGIRPGRIAAALRDWRQYARDRRRFRDEATRAGWTWGTELPILGEHAETSGAIGTYFIQDQLVARWILAAGPERHVDVGSRLDGFVGHLSVFRRIDVIDLRPPPMEIDGVRFHQLDLTGELGDEWVACTDSLSCLHSLEHFGLGRYGDAIDVDGHLKGLARMQQMVRPGGVLYLSTPIGPERIEFNAHRVFAPGTLAGWFATGWRIERSAVIDEGCAVREGPGTEALDSFRGHLGTGIVVARRTV